MTSDNAAVAFMLGDTSPEVLAELRAAMLRWSAQRDDKPIWMQRYHGIGTPRASRMAMRDALLVEASDLLTGSRWARCQQLAELARAFDTRRYDVWRRHGIPEKAGAVDLLLFRACEQGEPMPKTPESFLSILPEPA